ncbi:MAG: helix-turn-helix domain-containing protein [Alistipes sp.]|nr:helix-turn-helix domain-containing protein [Alistipes sp.]
MKKKGHLPSPVEGTESIGQRQGRILSITRKCAYCNKPFEAHSCSTLFCSKTCYNRDYYKRHKQKIRHRQVQRNIDPNETRVQSSIQLSEPKNTLSIDPATDLISVAEAAKRLHVCRQTVYNLGHAQKIRIIHVTTRLSFVRWSELLARFSTSDDFTCSRPHTKKTPLIGSSTPIKNSKLKHITPPCNWIDSKQASIRYGVTVNTLYVAICRNRVPRKREGGMTLYSTKHLDAAMRFIPKQLTDGLITLKDAALKYNLPIPKIRYLIVRFGIQSKKIRGKIMFQETDFKKIFTSIKTA